MENCCIWLVIYLNCTMMHGLTNLKFKIHNHVLVFGPRVLAIYTDVITTYIYFAHVHYRLHIM
jgi:hypothetical protein